MKLFATAVSILLSTSIASGFQVGKDPRNSIRGRQLSPAGGSTESLKTIIIRWRLQPGDDFTVTEEEVAERFFGENTNKNSFKRQFENCSYGNLEIEPANVNGGSGLLNSIYSCQNCDVDPLTQAVSSFYSGYEEDDYDLIIFCIPDDGNGSTFVSGRELVQYGSNCGDIITTNVLCR
jgi:hypothetical protein